MQKAEIFKRLRTYSVQKKNLNIMKDYIQKKRCRACKSVRDRLKALITLSFQALLTPLGLELTLYHMRWPRVTATSPWEGIRASSFIIEESSRKLFKSIIERSRRGSGKSSNFKSAHSGLRLLRGTLQSTWGFTNEQSSGTNWKRQRSW
jgi:hypothetical protein